MNLKFGRLNFKFFTHFKVTISLKSIYYYNIILLSRNLNFKGNYYNYQSKYRYYRIFTMKFFISISKLMKMIKNFINKKFNRLSVKQVKK